MFFFPHLTQEEINGMFSYKAIAFWCIPVYVQGDPKTEQPSFELAARNWVPSWSLRLAMHIWLNTFGRFMHPMKALILTKKLPNNWAETLNAETGEMECQCPGCITHREELAEHPFSSDIDRESFYNFLSNVGLPAEEIQKMREQANTDQERDGE